MRAPLTNDSISDTIKVDTARLPLLLNELRLPTIAALWPDFTERADREGWPAARLLATLAELELAERSQRRIQRHLTEARLPPDKTLDSIDFTALPMLSRAHVTALASGDGWISTGGTILLFGPSGSGKSHLAAAFGHTLVENGYRVLFTRTTDLVQRLQQARQALTLESAIEKLDKYHLLILDDLCYVRKDQAETSVLFELIAARYERRSLMVRAGQRRLVEIADAPEVAFAIEQPTLEQFLSGLRTAWQDGEVRPTARRKAPARKTKRNTPDPFRLVAVDLRAWFEAEPWRTSGELFDRLQTEYPGAYPDGQIRTLQRRIKDWRREKALLMVFGKPSTDEALGEEPAMETQ